MADVFISYRRDGGDMTAMYIFQALKDRGYSVFYDVDVLRSGKFNEELLKQIQGCTDFLVVLSPHALDRCNNQGDWVRLEIAEAIKEEKNIVPILMNGFSFPDDLPDDINELRVHTGLTSSTEYFQESMTRMCDKFLRSKPQKKRKRIAAFFIAVAVFALTVLFLILRTGGVNILKPAVTENKEEETNVVITNETVWEQEEKAANAEIGYQDVIGQDTEPTEKTSTQENIITNADTEE